MSATAARPGPFFVGDHPALDFVNSLATPRGAALDWLDGGEGLLDWLVRAGMLTPGVGEELRAADVLGTLDAVAARARALREWFRGFLGRHAGAPLGPGALGELRPLNTVLAGDDLCRQVEAAPPGEAGPWALRWASRRRWRRPDLLLLPPAEAMGDLVCSADFTHVRRCEGAGCSLWFYDRTKGHARRWCSMAACGNRAKAAAHRARLRTPPEPPNQE